MENFQRDPLKTYIQDIFRATQTPYNKYIYEIFGTTFKNIMIHGVVTSVSLSNCNTAGVNFELSDVTGTVHIYYDRKKTNNKICDGTMTDLHREFANASRFGDVNIQIMNTLMDRIVKRSKFEISEGMYLQVVGDIFVDDNRNIRMVSAYECTETSAERDLVWMEELKYLYEKFYLLDKV